MRDHFWQETTPSPYTTPSLETTSQQRQPLTRDPPCQRQPRPLNLQHRMVNVAVSQWDYCISHRELETVSSLYLPSTSLRRHWQGWGHLQPWPSHPLTFVWMLGEWSTSTIHLHIKEHSNHTFVKRIFLTRKILQVCSITLQKSTYFGANIETYDISTSHQRLNKIGFRWVKISMFRYLLQVITFQVMTNTLVCQICQNITQSKLSAVTVSNISYQNTANDTY